METVTDWADAQLAAQGVGRSGPIELHRERPWSTIWHLQTELGRVWLKECGAGGRYEAGLTALLAQVAPEWTLQPLAVEIERGWLLLPDGGPDLRSAMPSDRDTVVERWSTLLTEYAELQRRMADFAPHLQAVGVPDLRAEVAAERFRQLVGEHAEGELRDRLDDAAPSLERGWERLRASAVPATVQHDDLHDGSVLCGADGAGAPAFYDWGDATLSHPFASLLVSRRVLAATLDVDTDDPAVATVTDAYLRCWGDVAPAETLATELDDVWQLARLSRAWAWARALGDADPEHWSEWGHPVTAWLQELL
jgi:Phosphotransferase enzyme family